MNFENKLISGLLIKRYKRFFVDIKIGDKKVVAHCPNTGSMMGLLKKGNNVWLSKSDNPNRKLQYTLQIIEDKKTKVGTKVKQGEIIAYVGDSGRATGTHLHFEFWQGTKRTDPVKVQLPSAQPISKEELDKFLSELGISLQKLAEYNQTDNA